MTGVARRRRGDGAAGLAPGERVPPWYRLPPSPLVASGRGHGRASGQGSGQGSGQASGRVVVVGAGLAGCHLVHELALLGLEATLVDAAPGPARGASGNPIGIVKPFVTREPSAAERFHADAFAHLSALLEDAALAEAACFRPVGALQLVGEEWAGRDDLERLDAEAVRERVGSAPSGSGGALAFGTAGSLDPRALCAALLDRASPTTRFGRRLHALERHEDRWRIRLVGAHGPEHLDADAVVLANGPGIVDTSWTGWLPVTPARGQMTRFAVTADPVAGSGVPRTVVAAGSWVVPDGNGVWAGASYGRDDADAAPRARDDAANRRALETLLPKLVLASGTMATSAGVRATTPDRLPFAGPVPSLEDASNRYADLSRGRPPDAYAPPDYVDGLAVLGGFGSRGIVTSGRAAHLVARWLAGESAPLESATPLIGPSRFVVRPLVRGRVPRLREVVPDDPTSAVPEARP